MDAADLNKAITHPIALFTRPDRGAKGWTRPENARDWPRHEFSVGDLIPRLPRINSLCGRNVSKFPRAGNFRLVIAQITESADVFETVFTVDGRFQENSLLFPCCRASGLRCHLSQPPIGRLQLRRASIAVHRRFGFKPALSLRSAGFKFGPPETAQAQPLNSPTAR